MANRKAAPVEARVSILQSTQMEVDEVFIGTGTEALVLAKTPSMMALEAAPIDTEPALSEIEKAKARHRQSREAGLASMGGPAESDAAKEVGAWIGRGLCKGLDPELFFPERGESTKEQKRICGSCAVRQECEGSSLYEKFGMWGGQSERNRRKARSAKKAEPKVA